MHDGGDGIESRLILAPDDSAALIAMSNYAATEKDSFLEPGGEALKTCFN